VAPDTSAEGFEVLVQLVMAAIITSPARKAARLNPPAAPRRFKCSSANAPTLWPHRAKAHRDAAPLVTQRWTK
jgi:hypothetical protein